MRSQPSLSRIQLEEGSSPSGKRNAHVRNGSNDCLDDGSDSSYAAMEANSRIHTADYVEARGTLIPATEYLTRAVNIAERQGVLQGQLLSLVGFPFFIQTKAVAYEYVLGSRGLYKSRQCFLHTCQRATLPASTYLSSPGQSDTWLHHQSLLAQVRVR